MTKVIVISGFLGAGKTTFLNKVLPLLSGKKAVLENEFGETGIDGYLINEEVPVLEMVKGCICCSLLTEFKKGLKNILSDIEPQWLLIEPSGVSTLSGILEIIEEVKNEEGNIDDIYKVTLAESPVFMDFTESFGEFYKDQIKYSDAVFLTKNELIEEETGHPEDEELKNIEESIKALNSDALITTKDFRKIENDELISLITRKNNISGEASSIEKFDMDPDPLNSENMSNFRGRRIEFSSLSVRDVFLKERRETDDFLKKLMGGKYGNVLRIKGHISEGKERKFISVTTGSLQISDSRNINNTLVIIGEKIDRKGILNLLKRKSLAGKMVNRNK